MCGQTKRLVVAVFAGLLVVGAARPTYGVRVGWNEDIHVDYPIVNDFHLWGVLESSTKPPVFVNQINFQTIGPGGPAVVNGTTFQGFQSQIGGNLPAQYPLPADVPPDVGNPPAPPYYYFGANWNFPTNPLVYCQWMHFGVEFDEYGWNYGYWLQGAWTLNGVRLPAAGLPSIPSLGFTMPNTSSITFQNASGIEVQPQQMQAMILYPDEGAMFPLNDLTGSFFDTHPEWNSRFHDVGTLPSTLSGSGGTLTVDFSQVSGMRSLNPSEVLLARIQTKYLDPQGQQQMTWKYVVHGALPVVTTWVGSASATWSDPAAWQGSVTPSTFNHVIFDAPTAVTTNNNMSGLQVDGIEIKPTSQPVIVNGNSVTLGASVINEGTSSLTLNLPLTLTAAGHTFDTGSGTITVNGWLSENPGPGAVPVPMVKSGSGELVLNSGGNTYSGGTRIMQGTLTLQDASSLGTGAVSLNQAVLKVTAPITIPNPILPLEDGATILVPGTANSVIFSGPVSGPGGLTKTGPGTLTLAGLVDYTDGTHINAGRLVASGPSFHGGGDATVDSFFDIFTEVTVDGATTVQPGGRITVNPGGKFHGGSGVTVDSFFDIFGEVTVAGKTTVQNGGRLTAKPGGMFNGGGGAAVDSFFDIFTEVTVGGTATVGATGQITVGTGGRLTLDRLEGGGACSIISGTAIITQKGTGWTTNADAVQNIGSLSLGGGGGGGRLDVSNNLVRVNYGTGPSPYSDLAAAVNSGVITQSTSDPDRTVGIYDSGSSILVGYACPGDSMLRGRVNSQDIGRMLSAGKYGIGPSNARWDEGDFTHDGKVDSHDVGAILGSGEYNAGLYPALVMQPALVISGTFSAGRATIIYDATTGDVKIDPNGNTMTGFDLWDSAGNFFVGNATFPAGGTFTTDDATEKFWGCFTPANYLTAEFDLGNIAPSGLSEADFLAALNNAASDTVWYKSGGGTYDFNSQYVPEPSSFLLLAAGAAVGLLAAARRRRKL
jgi:autotransporter-associated beta strand protein